jgi:hypothetical protein
LLWFFLNLMEEGIWKNYYINMILTK